MAEAHTVTARRAWHAFRIKLLVNPSSVDDTFKSQIANHLGRSDFELDIYDPITSEHLLFLVIATQDLDLINIILRKRINLHQKDNDHIRLYDRLSESFMTAVVQQQDLGRLRPRKKIKLEESCLQLVADSNTKCNRTRR